MVELGGSAPIGILEYWKVGILGFRELSTIKPEAKILIFMTLIESKLNSVLLVKG